MEFATVREMLAHGGEVVRCLLQLIRRAVRAWSVFSLAAVASSHSMKRFVELKSG